MDLPYPARLVRFLKSFFLRFLEVPRLQISWLKEPKTWPSLKQTQKRRAPLYTSGCNRRKSQQDKCKNRTRTCKPSTQVYNVPKLKPYVAIKALLTIIIPTEVTILNAHAATSRDIFFSSLTVVDIFFDRI